MKKRMLWISLGWICLLEIGLIGIAIHIKLSHSQDIVKVNEVIHQVEIDWSHIETHQPIVGVHYVILNSSEEVIYQTKTGISQTIYDAILHRDTILDIYQSEDIVGKIIIYNDTNEILEKEKKIFIITLVSLIFIQSIICVLYYVYLYRSMISPFRKLENFAEQVAGGNLDIPLEMDKSNLFGAFTESFDIMRSELKKAQIAQAQANASKKELVAKLSHDIKTPIASIKAASEVGQELAETAKLKENYGQIIQKTDQINILVTNLFQATLEELHQLSVATLDMKSTDVQKLIENADYLRRAHMDDIPDILVLADRIRLQEVFDNLFANSYKYANTKIEVTFFLEKDKLHIRIADFGPGVTKEELPHLKEKFVRGENAKDIEGAGLGLYIADYYMKEMNGKLDLECHTNGFSVVVELALSGK